MSSTLIVLTALLLQTDAARRAPVHAPPQRIIAMAPNTAEVICSLGACDRIVGVSRFCVYPPELLERPRIGGLSDPDLERIIALRPDLLVMRGRVESLDRLSEQLEIGVYRDETDTLRGIEKCVEDMGRLLTREEKATEVVRDFRDRLERIRTRVAGRPRPRVLLSIARDPERIANLLTAGKGTFLDEMLEIAGGVNVFGNLDMFYPQVSPEAIIAQRPDVIIELMPETRLDASTEASLRAQWKQLDSIPAVATNRIHFVTDDNCLIPSPRYVEIIARISGLLHPDEAERHQK